MLKGCMCTLKALVFDVRLESHSSVHKSTLHFLSVSVLRSAYVVAVTNFFELVPIGKLGEACPHGKCSSRVCYALFQSLRI